MFMYYLVYYNKIFITVKYIFVVIFSKISYKIFNEGFLIDFNQKKFVANVLKKFVFNSFFLFNDRFLYEKISYFLIDFFIFSKNFFMFNDSKHPNLLFNITFIYLFIFMILFF